MNFVCRLLPGLLALAALGMSKPPPITVRFYVEANARDGDAFAKPITLHNPEREAYIERVPSISEQSIKAMYAFQAKDGSWGVAFKLDPKGRMDLEVASTAKRGGSMVVFVMTPKGVHQVIDMLIDKPVRDGIITIPKGLTEKEIASLSKVYPLIGQARK